MSVFLISIKVQIEYQFRNAQRLGIYECFYAVPRRSFSTEDYAIIVKSWHWIFILSVTNRLVFKIKTNIAIMEKATKANKSAATKKSAKPDNKAAITGKTDKSQMPLLEKFFIDELKDIYWAEKHLVKALPKMQKAATSQELANAFAEHKVATEEHVSRLEKVFELMEETARAKKCEAMEGLVKEAQSIIEDTDEKTATRDVGLIMAAQKVEHYEIATYGGLVQLAKTIGRDDVAEILQKTLNEEKETDELLTSIAENSANVDAEED
jgi:ferritin-like metal-binding protein YciE